MLKLYYLVKSIIDCYNVYHIYKQSYTAVLLTVARETKYPSC